MAETKKIKTALVSVFHKDGLDELLAKLNEEGVKFLRAQVVLRSLSNLWVMNVKKLRMSPHIHQSSVVV